MSPSPDCAEKAGVVMMQNPLAKSSAADPEHEEGDRER